MYSVMNAEPAVPTLVKDSNDDSVLPLKAILYSVHKGFTTCMDKMIFKNFSFCGVECRYRRKGADDLNEKQE